MYDVITIGAATQDVFLRSKAWETIEDETTNALNQCFPLGAKLPIDDILFATGGGATNAAVTFSRLGHLCVAAVCEIGKDDPGAIAILADLERNCVLTEFIRRDQKFPTACSVILVAGSGERTILVYRGASQRLAVKQIPWRKLRTKWFYVTSLGGDLTLMRKILGHAERIGANVAWNPGGNELAAGWKAIAPLAERCAVFSINREEAAALTRCDLKNLEGILRALCPTPLRPPSRRKAGEQQEGAETPRIILVTDGPGGAYACDGRGTWHIASRRLKTVNTTGAGDAFGSAFVLGLMQVLGLSPPRPPTLRSEQAERRGSQVSGLDYALRLAMANAEGVITHMGAKAGILSRMPSRTALAKYYIRELKGSRALEL